MLKCNKMSNIRNVNEWTKKDCIAFLRTVKGAKISGSKSELIRSTSRRKSAICNVLSHRYKQNSNSEICSDYSLDGAQFDQVTSTTSEVEACPEVSIDQKDHIEKVTRSQRTNPLWHQHRQYRITSSTARKELHSTGVGRPALIDKIMNQQPIRNEENISPAMLYGIKNEEKARKRFADLTGQVVQECGSFIDGIILASPDGYIPETDHLLEIKGLASQRDRKVIEAIKDRQSLKSYPYI